MLTCLDADENNLEREAAACCCDQRQLQLSSIVSQVLASVTLNANKLHPSVGASVCETWTCIHVCNPLCDITRGENLLWGGMGG